MHGVSEGASTRSASGLYAKLRTSSFLQEANLADSMIARGPVRFDSLMQTHTESLQLNRTTLHRFQRCSNGTYRPLWMFASISTKCQAWPATGLATGMC